MKGWRSSRPCSSLPKKPPPASSTTPCKPLPSIKVIMMVRISYDKEEKGDEDDANPHPLWGWSSTTPCEPLPSKGDYHDGRCWGFPMIMKKEKMRMTQILTPCQGVPRGPLVMVRPNVWLKAKMKLIITYQGHAALVGFRCNLFDTITWVNTITLTITITQGNRLLVVQQEQEHWSSRSSSRTSVF